MGCIADFTHGDDLIDLSLIDANTAMKKDQAFGYGGKTSDVLANKVTWHEENGSAIIAADVDGDSEAALTLLLYGTGFGFGESDFLF